MIETVVTTITILMIGFSVCAAAILWLAYLLFLKNMDKTKLGLAACTVLLVSLSVLQMEHLNSILYGTELFDLKRYVFLLLATPPAFYFFSKEVLIPGSTKSWLELLNLIPLALSLVLSTEYIAPVAFAIGAAYSIWFASYVYGMRRNVKRFRFEMFFFAFFALLAVSVLILGVLLPKLETTVFYIAYANFTGIAMILIVGTLIVFPDLVSDISDAAKLTYASSTLKGVDTTAVLTNLKVLMREEKIYQNEDLSLSLVAKELGISGHQLSELVNTQFGVGFSRYIREQRVAEARKLLETDWKASVLSISLQTGFKSQSNFYAAFKEITGITPGSYRSNLQDSDRPS